MPKARTPGLPQVNGSLIYGSIPIEVMPDATQAGDMMYWDGVQWQFIRLIGGGGLDITYDAVNKTVEIYYADNRVYATFLADSIIRKTTAAQFTADAVLA